MPERRIARITSKCLNGVKRKDDRINVIGLCLQMSGIEFSRDRENRKINIAPPFEVFRDINTNDIVVRQWSI